MGKEEQCHQNSKSLQSARVGIVSVARHNAFAMPEVILCMDGPCATAVLASIHADITANDDGSFGLHGCD